MFSIAGLLERAKSNANIESDYRLSKVLRINQSAISNYRHRGNVPTDSVIDQLCGLSGDDAAVYLALASAARAKGGRGEAIWQAIAERLSDGDRRLIPRARTAILSVFFAILAIAGHPIDAQAGEGQPFKSLSVNSIYIVSNAFLSVCCFLESRLRRWREICAVIGLSRLVT